MRTAAFVESLHDPAEVDDAAADSVQVAHYEHIEGALGGGGEHAFQSRALLDGADALVGVDLGQLPVLVLDALARLAFLLGQ
jgi:hypothetical protein